jgi:hypothetical protein
MAPGIDPRWHTGERTVKQASERTIEIKNENAMNLEFIQERQRRIGA